jgi:Tfp pilus assembly protein FimT
VPKTYTSSYCSDLANTVCSQCSKDDSKCLACTTSETNDKCDSGNALKQGVAYKKVGQSTHCKDASNAIDFNGNCVPVTAPLTAIANCVFHRIAQDGTTITCDSCNVNYAPSPDFKVCNKDTTPMGAWRSVGTASDNKFYPG